MTDITEEKAKEALDFIAKKIGYEAMAISLTNLLYVLSGSNTRRAMLYHETDYGMYTIIAHNFKQALMRVLGTTCTTISTYTFMSKKFTVPDSLDELLVMMDMES